MANSLMNMNMMIDIVLCIAEYVQEESDLRNLLHALALPWSIVPSRIMFIHHNQRFRRIRETIPAHALSIMAPQLKLWLTTTVADEVFRVLHGPRIHGVTMIDALAQHCLGHNAGYTSLQSRLRWKRQRLLQPGARYDQRTALSIRDAAHVFSALLPDMSQPSLNFHQRIGKAPHELDATDDERVLDVLLTRLPISV